MARAPRIMEDLRPMPAVEEFIRRMDPLHLKFASRTVVREGGRYGEADVLLEGIASPERLTHDEGDDCHGGIRPDVPEGSDLVVLWARLTAPGLKTGTLVYYNGDFGVWSPVTSETDRERVLAVAAYVQAAWDAQPRTDDDEAQLLTRVLDHHAHRLKEPEDRRPATDQADEIGMAEGRLYDLLYKWIDIGFWECGVNPRWGWFQNANYDRWRSEDSDAREYLAKLKGAK